MRALVVIVLIAVVALVFLSLLPQRRIEKHDLNRPTYQMETIRKGIRDVTPPDVVAGPKVSGGHVARLPAVVPPPPKAPPPKPNILHKLVVTSAGILKSGDSLIQIADITPLKLDAICSAGDGKNWPCGRFARTALRQLIRGRSVVCDRKIKRKSVTKTSCTVGKRNIAQWLVEQGWAKPSNERFSDEFERARAAKIGMWRVGSRP